MRGGVPWLGGTVKGRVWSMGQIQPLTVYVLRCCIVCIFAVLYVSTFSASIVPDMKVQGQLACPEVKKKYKKKCCVVYKCSLYMMYHAPMMFTCIKV